MGLTKEVKKIMCYNGELGADYRKEDIRDEYWIKTILDALKQPLYAELSKEGRKGTYIGTYKNTGLRFNQVCDGITYFEKLQVLVANIEKILGREIVVVDEPCLEERTRLKINKFNKLHIYFDKRKENEEITKDIDKMSKLSLKDLFGLLCEDNRTRYLKINDREFFTTTNKAGELVLSGLSKDVEIYNNVFHKLNKLVPKLEDKGLLSIADAVRFMNGKKVDTHTDGYSKTTAMYHVNKAFLNADIKGLLNADLSCYSVSDRIHRKDLKMGSKGIALIRIRDEFVLPIDKATNKLPSHNLMKEISNKLNLLDLIE